MRATRAIIEVWVKLSWVDRIATGGWAKAESVPSVFFSAATLTRQASVSSRVPELPILSPLLVACSKTFLIIAADTPYISTSFLLEIT